MGCWRQVGGDKKHFLVAPGSCFACIDGSVIKHQSSNRLRRFLNRSSKNHSMLAQIRNQNGKRLFAVIFDCRSNHNRFAGLVRRLRQRDAKNDRTRLAKTPTYHSLIFLGNRLEQIGFHIEKGAQGKVFRVGIILASLTIHLRLYSIANEHLFALDRRRESSRKMEGKGESVTSRGEGRLSVRLSAGLVP